MCGILVPMGWPPTERDVLKFARDSYLLTRLTISDIGWADFDLPKNQHGVRLLLVNGVSSMINVNYPGCDAFSVLTDRQVDVYSPEFVEPLVEKGLLAIQENEYCTLYTLTKTGVEKLNEPITH